MTGGRVAELGADVDGVEVDEAADDGNGGASLRLIVKGCSAGKWPAKMPSLSSCT